MPLTEKQKTNEISLEKRLDLKKKVNSRQDSLLLNVDGPYSENSMGPSAFEIILFLFWPQTMACRILLSRTETRNPHDLSARRKCSLAGLFVKSHSCFPPRKEIS